MYLDKTTKFSPHLKFGTISIRELYHADSNNVKLINEYYWWDFYAYTIKNN